MAKIQKFFRGDFVRIGDMPPEMSNFAGDCKAIVIASEAEIESGDVRDDGHKIYILFVLKKGKRGYKCWYHEDQMTLIEPSRFDLLPESNYFRKVEEARIRRDAQFTW